MYKNVLKKSANSKRYSLMMIKMLKFQLANLTKTLIDFGHELKSVDDSLSQA